MSSVSDSAPVSEQIHSGETDDPMAGNQNNSPTWEWPAQSHRNHRSPVQTFQDGFRREVSRVIRKSPLLQATEYCAEIMLDAGSQLVPSMESVYSLRTCFKGYSYYDHGHPFKN